MTENIDHLNKIIESLKLRLAKPGMYFIDSLHCKGFIQGLRFTLVHLNVVNYKIFDSICDTLTRKRGWTWIANSYQLELQSRGIDEYAIIIELITLEIDVLHEVIWQLEQSSQP